MLQTPHQVVDKYETEAEIAAFYEGARLELYTWAHYKDGEMFVGSCGKTYKWALSELDKDEALVLNLLRERKGIEEETQQIIAARQE